MDLKLLLVTQFVRNRDLAGIGDELRRQVPLARDGGFDGVGVSEHHTTADHQYLLNEAVIAHLADAVGDMRLTTALCLLPYHNPVRIAEFGPTIDVLTGGRFRFGVDRADGPGRLVEVLDVIERCWTADAVSVDGEHFDFEDVTIRPKPHQDPRPPIWVGASNESSVRRGALSWTGSSAGTSLSMWRDGRSRTSATSGRRPTVA